MLIGVSHRRGGASALEAWQTTFTPGALMELGSFGVNEWVSLVTCNRWDVVVALPEAMNVEEARHRLTPQDQSIRPYAYVGDGALEHLTRIAASLDGKKTSRQNLSQLFLELSQRLATEDDGSSWVR